MESLLLSKFEKEVQSFTAYSIICYVIFRIWFTARRFAFLIDYQPQDVVIKIKYAWINKKQPILMKKFLWRF